MTQTFSGTAVIGIEYEEFGTAESYKGVTIYRGDRADQEEELVFTGDVVQDYRVALEKVESEGRAALLSSSCDDFVHDTKGYRWVESPKGERIIAVRNVARK